MKIKKIRINKCNITRTKIFMISFHKNKLKMLNVLNSIYTYTKKVNKLF